MQTAPANWDSLWAAGADVELRAVIGGVAHGMGQIISCKAYPAAFSGLAVGQAVSSQLSLSFVSLGPVPKSAEIRLQARLRSGNLSTAWVPQGTYYIDAREREAELGTLTVTAFDRMMFAEELYFSNGVLTGPWPRAAASVLSDICRRLGVTLDSRSRIDSSLQVAAPVNLTMRDVLREIAAAHGGNFIFTPAGQLRLLPLEPLPELTLLGSERGDFAGDEFGNRVLIVEGGFTDLACEDARSAGDPVQISRVVLALDDENAWIAGNESGYTLTASCFLLDQDAANLALSRLNGVRYCPAEVSGAVFSPLLELGDAVYGGGNLFRIYQMEIEYQSLCTARLSAPIEGDVEHEIPYQSSTERLVNWKAAQTRAAIAMDLDRIRLEVSNELQGLSSSIDIQLDRITSQVQGLEGNVSTLTQTAGSLEIKVEAAEAGMSSIRQTVDSITAEVSTLDGDISRVAQKVDSITLSVSNGQRSSWISLMANGVEIVSERIAFTGAVVFESDLSDGQTLISGDCIQTGEISARYIKLGGMMELYESLNDSKFGGYFGYMEGMAADGQITQGVGIMAGAGSGQLLCSSRGARIGYSSSSAVTCTSNKVTLTGSSIVVDGTLQTSSGSIITSDRRKKTGIQRGMERYLSLFDRLRPVSFRMKNGGKRRHLGFLAQEVEAAMEAAGIDRADFAALVVDEGGNYGLRYEEFIPLLVEKVQRLEKELRAWKRP